MSLGYLHVIVVAIVIASWCVVGLTMVFRKRSSDAQERQREPSSIVGMALQGVGFALVFGIRRAHLGHLANSAVPAILISFVTMALALASAGLVVAAVLTLGKQWSLAARVVSEHNLITHGPYQFVRHPIYCGMFGLLLATGLAVSHWFVLLASTLCYVAGTYVRVRAEEKLLRESFGPEFEVYASRVRAVIPGLF